jgi:hypothetical protein
MSKKIERYEGRSAEDLNAKNCCAFCGATLGTGRFRIFSNKRLEWFDRESCRTKRNADLRAETKYENYGDFFHE